MKKSVFLILFAVVFRFSFSQSPTYSSAVFFIGNNSNYITDVVTDASGNIFSTGYFYGNLDLIVENFPALSESRSFVMKGDAAGNPIWAVGIRGGGTCIAECIAIAPDGSVYAGGVFRSKLVVGTDSIVSGSPNNCFLVKLDGSGNLVWMKHWAGLPGESGFNKTNLKDIAIDDAGNIYYTGFFTNELTFGATTLTPVGTNDLMFGKLDPAGNSVWMKKAGGGYSGTCGLPNNDSGNAIALDNQGNIFISGHFAFNFTIGGLSASSGNDIEAFVAKLDNDGNALWVKAVNGLAVQTSNSLATDPLGNVIFVGHFQIECYINGDTLLSYSATSSPYDMFIVKYDPAGNFLWYRHEGHTQGGDYPEGALCDAGGNIYVMGKHTSSTQIGDTTLVSSPSWADRIFLVCYDPSGNTRYVSQCGGEKNFPLAIAFNQNEDIVMAGSADIGSTAGITFGSITCPGGYGHYPYIVVVDNPTFPAGLNSFQDSFGFELFPVPASRVLNFESAVSIHQVQISDLTGRSVFETENQNGIHSVSFELPSGIYFLKARSGEKVSSRRLVISE